MSLCDFHYQVLRAEKGVLDEQAAGRASAAALRKELSQAEDAHRASLAKSRDEITILGLEKSKAAQQNRREIAALRAQLSAGTSDVYASMHYMKTPTGPSGRPQAAEAGSPLNPSYVSGHSIIGVGGVGGFSVPTRITDEFSGLHNQQQGQSTSPQAMSFEPIPGATTLIPANRGGSPSLLAERLHARNSPSPPHPQQGKSPEQQGGPDQGFSRAVYDQRAPSPSHAPAIDNQQRMREENERREQRMRERRMQSQTRSNAPPVQVQTYHSYGGGGGGGGVGGGGGGGGGSIGGGGGSDFSRSTGHHAYNVPDDDRAAAMAVINGTGGGGRLVWRDEAPSAGALVSPYPKDAPSQSSSNAQHHYNHRSQDGFKGKSILKKNAGNDYQNLSPSSQSDQRHSSMKNYASKLSNRQAIRKEHESASRWQQRESASAHVGVSPNSRTI